MNLLPLVEKLELAGLGIQAKTLFVNQLPIECVEGVMLRGLLSGTPIDHELPGYYKTGFHMVVRANSYAGGQAKANAVLAALTVNNTLIGGMLFKFIRPKTLPVVFPISKGNLLEFAVDFDVAFTV